MRRLLVDTNIVLDLLARREPFYNEAAKLFSLADKKELYLTVSALSFANVNYILLKEKSQKEAKSILRQFKLLVEVLPLDDKIIGISLNDDDFNDYEDAIQYFSAVENKQDAIITRNLKDFRKSKIPVMTAGQYCKVLK